MDDLDRPKSPPPPPQVIAAGFWRRAAAFALDTVVVALIAAALWTSFGLVSWDAWPAERWNLLDQLVEVVNGQAHLLAMALVAGAVALAYGLAAEALTGGTPGKLLVRARVVGPYGGHAGFGRLLLRNVVKVVGTAALGIGPLWCIVDRQRRALHDRAAGTHVAVVTSSAPRRSPASGAMARPRTGR